MTRCRTCNMEIPAGEACAPHGIDNTYRLPEKCACCGVDLDMPALYGAACQVCGATPLDRAAAIAREVLSPPPRTLLADDGLAVVGRER